MDSIEGFSSSSSGGSWAAVRAAPFLVMDDPTSRTMASTSSAVSPQDRRGGVARSRRRASDRVRGVMEAGVLAMVCLSPWAFGAVEPRSEFLLDLGIAALLVLWGTRMLLDGRLSWRNGPLAWCLAALVLVGFWQVTPLPRGLLGRISPATARTYDRLLPAQPEVLPFGEPRGGLNPPAGSTLSVYPGATWQETIRLLAALSLFAAVRNNVASAASLRRLSLAALINGSLLAFFGVIQFFSSNPRTIYWTYPTSGSVFGPYVNRNHFAFYVNVCTCLGAGLLLARSAGRGVEREGRRPSPRRLLDPEALGMSFALALMVSGMLLSLSRGGFLALLGGLIFGLLIWLLQNRFRRSPQGRILILTVAVALSLISWLGYDRVSARLTTFQAGREQRFSVWSRALPVVRDFPLWGTGYGTYEFADLLHRTGADAPESDVIYDHADNDYLEALVEGGLARLIPILLAIVLAFRVGLRAVRRNEGRPAGALALGALMGFATVAIHSFSDYGLHIPANAVLVLVLCAHLCALGLGSGGAGREQPADRESVDQELEVRRFRGLAPALGAVLAVALGLLLVNEGWRAHRAQQLRKLASDLEASSEPDGPERKVAHLEQAARLVPGYARLQAEVADAHLAVFEQRMADPPRGGPSDVERLKRKHVVPALRNYLRSRDLCPMRAEAHVDIAAHVGELARAEPRRAYLDRAKLLDPSDPWLWYRCGTFELADGQSDRAWANWQRSLELSNVHLPEILEGCAGHLGPHDILRRVLPDRPGLLLEAARSLYPQPGAGRRPFLEKALTVLEKTPGPPNAENLHTKATILRELGRPAAALEAYRAALALEPMQLDWRYELAELLSDQGQFQGARQELLTILALRPDDARSRTLMDSVTQKVAEGR